MDEFSNGFDINEKNEKPLVRLTEEEVREILSSAHTPYEAICAAENMLVRKNTINKSDPNSVDLQSRCRGDNLRYAYRVDKKERQRRERDANYARIL